MAEIEEILTFWFGDPGASPAFDQDRQKLWFGGGEAVDRLIRERFAETLAQAGRGEFDCWAHGSRGNLALILLFDQFPRNIFRGEGRAYAYDAQALNHTLGGMARRQDSSLSIVERAFFYMPLEHAEDLEMQRRSVRAFEALRAEAPAELKPMCEGFLDYAWHHLRIIERFSRFPHRNAALGRPSTEAEKAFLQQPGSSF